MGRGACPDIRTMGPFQLIDRAISELGGLPFGAWVRAFLARGVEALVWVGLGEVLVTSPEPGPALYFMCLALLTAAMVGPVFMLGWVRPRQFSSNQPSRIISASLIGAARFLLGAAAALGPLMLGIGVAFSALSSGREQVFVLLVALVLSLLGSILGFWLWVRLGPAYVFAAGGVPFRRALTEGWAATAPPLATRAALAQASLLVMEVATAMVAVTAITGSWSPRLVMDATSYPLALSETYAAAGWRLAGAPLGLLSALTWTHTSQRFSASRT